MKTSTIEKIKPTTSYAAAFILLPAVAGALTGAWVFAFKLAASWVIKTSKSAYGYFRANPAAIPLMILGMLILALVVSLILKFSPMSKGGGIPTAIAALRGLIVFRWLRTLFCVFVSSILTFLSGVPLGNEGPSVQMGTSVGHGVTMAAGKRFKCSDRYTMTGGACAGFAVATGAPLSGVFFALEDAHRRFTPTIIISAITGVLAGSAVSELLAGLSGTSLSTFEVPMQIPLVLDQAWIAVVVGVAAALTNYGVLMLYSLFRKLWNKTHKIPNAFKLMCLFAATALIGIVFPYASGTGHELTDEVLAGRIAFYMLLILLGLRGVLTLFASASGVTGGLFVPLIVFGAICGGICAKLMELAGMVSPEYYTTLTVIGIASFLGASLKTPVTAIILSLELFGGLLNTPFIMLGVGTAFILSELTGQLSINDTVMMHKLNDSREGGERRTLDVRLSVQADAFAIGKETRDILWPASCQVLTIESLPGLPPSHTIRDGDILRIHLETYDFDRTVAELCALLGDQEVLPSTVALRMHMPSSVR